MQRSDRGWLPKDDVAELRALVECLPKYIAGQVYKHILPSGKTFAFRLEEGGESRVEDAITAGDLMRDERFVKVC